MSGTVLLVLAWYAIGLVGSGFVVAESIHSHNVFPFWSDLERQQKRREAIGFGLGYAVFGPVALFWGVLMTGFGQYGWWRESPSLKEARTRP